mmetsp:Transcript_89005/g.254834  ORF Transcript_89005/g.254834 Transcript_89005/m.254834 type:complete len:236 (+) Transcript_89005:1335-2042(+)
MFFALCVTAHQPFPSAGPSTANLPGGRCGRMLEEVAADFIGVATQEILDCQIVESSQLRTRSRKPSRVTRSAQTWARVCVATSTSSAANASATSGTRSKARGKRTSATCSAAPAMGAPRLPTSSEPVWSDAGQALAIQDNVTDRICVDSVALRRLNEKPLAFVLSNSTEVQNGSEPCASTADIPKATSGAHAKGLGNVTLSTSGSQVPIAPPANESEPSCTLASSDVATQEALML